MNSGCSQTRRTSPGSDRRSIWRYGRRTRLGTSEVHAQNGVASRKPGTLILEEFQAGAGYPSVDKVSITVHSHTYT
jgi:hypothetical protein